jgi:hypothetical protein
VKDFDAIIIGTGHAGPSLAAWSAMRTRQSPSWTGLDLVADAALVPCLRSNLYSTVEPDRYVVGDKSQPVYVNYPIAGWFLRKIRLAQFLLGNIEVR